MFTHEIYCIYSYSKLKQNKKVLNLLRYLDKSQLLSVRKSDRQRMHQFAKNNLQNLEENTFKSSFIHTKIL